jgi:nucleoside-diphosphate-sugar epimerase
MGDYEKVPQNPSKPHLDKDSRRTLVFGCGYLGQCVAEKAVFVHQKVWATSRRASKAGELTSRGIEPLVADWTDKGALCGLPTVDQILISVSFDRQADQSRVDSQIGGLRNLLEVTSPEAHICYISTTGVYHQRDGSWVDEDSPTRPSREGGLIHLQAEQLLRELRPNSPWTILRLAGIYGPGRVPRVADVMAGRPIASPQDGFLNLIHVEDAAEAVMAAWTRSKRRLYVVGDDCPVVRGEFYREVARRCDAPSPRFIEPASDAPVRQRAETNKRVRNRRFKSDLVTKLRFPTYREGLASVI